MPKYVLCFLVTYEICVGKLSFLFELHIVVDQILSSYHLGRIISATSVESNLPFTRFIQVLENYFGVNVNYLMN